ncbi:hypothetical protein GIB67_039560 [Kingdonia uniflora]|uniref:Uncharacterized protein n=1 Tax=Kingdonia uniflora TaxID=39325 RepID=A0A7J7P6V7_9MAGN|nr:hypothetical protein GIB67_039560 [Kingdonia uniflora]
MSRIEISIAQLASGPSTRDKGTFLSQTQPNPKDQTESLHRDQANAVIPLRSGKTVDNKVRMPEEKSHESPNPSTEKVAEGGKPICEETPFIKEETGQVSLSHIELIYQICANTRMYSSKDELLENDVELSNIRVPHGEESDMLELQSRLNTMTIELSCKDVEILTANNEAELWKKSLKKKKLETMAANQQELNLLNTEIRHMRERLKKLNWDLREARDSCQRKSDPVKTHEEACSKRDQKLNETINKCNTPIAVLDRERQALILECMQGNEVYVELHVKYKES